MVRLLLLGMLLLCGFGGAAHAQAGPAPGTKLWEFRAGGPIWGPLVEDRGMLYFGSDDRHLYALDRATRRPRWKFATGGAVRARPAIAGDLVYAASDDGFLYAVDRASGRERWRFDLKARDLARRPPSPDNPYFDYLQSSPLVHEGQVFIGSLNGALFVVDAATGKLAWSVGTLDAVRSTPVVAGSRVYFGSWDDHLYAVDLATRKIAWRADTGGIVQSTPAVGGGRVVVGSRSARLVAYDAATGAEAWRHDYPDGSWVESSAVHADGYFYVGSSDSLKVSAFAADTGREAWQFKTGGWTWATPRLANGTLYVGAISAAPYYFEGVTLRPGFFALDPATGREKWRFVPGPAQDYVTGGVMGSPEVVDGVVYVGALDGRVYALKE
jgi:outer membrane protein assembly factor BamB